MKIHTHPLTFLGSLATVMCAFTAVVLSHPEMLTHFYLFYASTALTVMITFARVDIYTGVLHVMTHSRIVRTVLRIFIRMDKLQRWVLLQLQDLSGQGVVYFTKSAKLSQIKMALQYIEENEEARWVRVVHVYSKVEDIPFKLLDYVNLLDCVYPSSRIDCILVHGDFGPATVRYIAKRTQVPVNCMFINCPTDAAFRHGLGDLGGVRVIGNSEEKGSLMDGIKCSVDCEPEVDLELAMRGSFDSETQEENRLERFPFIVRSENVDLLELEEGGEDDSPFGRASCPDNNNAEDELDSLINAVSKELSVWQSHRRTPPLN